MYHIDPKCLRIPFLFLRTDIHMCAYIHLCALYCAVLMLLFVCTSISLSPPPPPPPLLQKRHLNMTVQGHKTQKVLIIASISTTETASQLKTRLEGVKQEWEVVSSQLPLRIAELEYKRNVQVRAWSRRGGYFVVSVVCTALGPTHRDSALHLINPSVS